MATTIARPATPPTTPPTIAPLPLCVAEGDAEADADEEGDAVLVPAVVEGVLRRIALPAPGRSIRCRWAEWRNAAAITQVADT